MFKKDFNPVAELIELKLRVIEPGDNFLQYDLKAELRVYKGEIETERTSFVVAVRRILLRLDLSGLEIAPGSRFGEPVRQNKIVEMLHSNEASESRKSANASASGSLSQTGGASGEAKAGAEIAGSVKRTLTKERTEESVSHLVTARGNNTWEACETAGGTLNGTYLNDDVLCCMSRLTGANINSILAVAEAKQRDLQVDVEGGLLDRITVNQKRLIGIFIAKCVEGSEYKGRVTLCRSEIELD